MKAIKSHTTIGFFMAGILLLMVFPLAGRTATKGQIVYVSQQNGFFQRGGDPATHAAGSGPLIGTTVFEGLVDMGVRLETLPAVAKSWRIAPDWSYIDFEIQKGIKFHNGDPLTSEDIKFSFETHMRSDLKQVLGLTYKARIKSIETPEPYKVRFNLNMPAPDLWKRFWWNGAIMPKKYREKVGDAGFADKPVGSGPFKWVDYKQDQYYTMEAVHDHHRKSPEFKTFKIVFVPEHSTRLAMLQAGEADIIQLLGPHIAQIKADPKFKLVQVKHIVGQTLAYCDLNFPEEKSPFLDKRVREAASLAIDRQGICQKVLFGGSEPYGEALSPYTMGWDSNVKPDPYNPERAKKLLAEAGYPNGFSTSINTTASQKFWAEAIAANLTEAGIKTEVKLWEGAQWYEAHIGKKIRGLLTRASWYNAEVNAGANLQDAYMEGMPWAYVTTKEISDSIKKTMASRNDKEAAELGQKLSKLVRADRINIHLWSNHANFGTTQRIVQWDQQLGSYPGSRFEYMKVKD